MHVLLQHIYPTRDAVSILLALVFGGVLGLLIYQGGMLMLLFLLSLCGAFLLIALAYFRPLLTIGLWILLAGIGDEVTAIYLNFGGSGGSLALGGGIDMRLFDPILLGVAGALLAKLVFGDVQSRERMSRYCFFWLLLTSWLLFEVARSVGDYGIVSAIGEFRTSFAALLILPYVVVFMRTPRQQRQLFLLLLVASLAYILIGLTAGGLLYGFSFAAYEKWLRSDASLALVLGALALYLSYRYGLWRRSHFLFITLLGFALTLTIISGHRSVWLAIAVVLLFLLVMGAIPLSRTLSFGAGLLLCTITLSLLFPQIDLLAFVNERMAAFTSYADDTTASWRMQIWTDAWNQSQAHLLEGKGFGNYFLLYDARGNPVTVSLHNQYVQLLYQIGLIGLALYLLLATQTAHLLWKAHAVAEHPFTCLVTLMAMTALVAGSVYYLAYSFEPFTWLYVGLGLAAAASRNSRVKPSTRP